MLRYDRQLAFPGLVALYDIRPGNGAGPFLVSYNPGARTGQRWLINKHIIHIMDSKITQNTNVTFKLKCPI